MAPDEIYDVVDKNGHQLGTASWTECHTKGLLHQCVHGLIFNNKSREKILIQKRSKNAIQEPNKWEASTAGHLVSGETPEEGILRELEEELFANHKLPNSIKARKITTFLNNDIPNNNELVYLFEIIYQGPFYYQKLDYSRKPLWIDFDRLLKDINKNPAKYAQFFINDMKEFVSSRQKKT